MKCAHVQTQPGMHDLGRDERDRCTLEEQRERWERKRDCTARELLQTERIYVEDLELITKFYNDVFLARCGHLKIAERGICGAIPEIVKVNKILLSCLDGGSISPGFETFSQSLDLYKKHADSIEPTLLVLKTQTKKNKLFARFKKLQESRPEFHARSLEQLLELPLLRLLRYKHYLRDLAENSHPRSSDTKKLIHALNAVSDACQYVEDISMSQENNRQLQRVQKMLKGRRLCIVGPGRWYIREGWLSLVPQSGEEVKHRMLFLFSDILVVTSPCNPLHPTCAHKFQCRAIYPLKECQVERVLGHTQSQGGLISLSFEKEKVMLMSSIQDDINDWYDRLVTAVRKIHSNSENFKKCQFEENLEKHRPPVQKAHKRTQVQEIEEGLVASHSIAEFGVMSKRIKMGDERSPEAYSQDSPTVDKAGWSCVLL
ncbi:Rho guanine nucleotide exchange factor 39 [Pelobates cultripes]|uniref:Rho guanine nucleotide exchange factor 39 n=1 Tax=Pelobates cultripes TaxID=61616 RepID=A0AAD1SCT6_PELCU|nr:Rho guanine nucleotide exchange factor 39 [Pelobates cultripes]